MSTTYDVSGVLPEEVLVDLPRGTNVLISGPALIGKQTLAIRLLAAGHAKDDGIICITTSQNAASLLADFETEIPTLDRDRIGIVDCSGSDERRVIEEIATEHVSSPADLTGISIGTAKLLALFDRQNVTGIRHGLVSVSTVIQYLDVDTAFKFLHIYTARISDTGGLGVFTVDDGAHDPQEINTIRSEFDGIIELRETDAGDREFRILGFPGTTREWRPFE